MYCLLRFLVRHLTSTLILVIYAYSKASVIIKSLKMYLYHDTPILVCQRSRPMKPSLSLCTYQCLQIGPSFYPLIIQVHLHIQIEHENNSRLSFKILMLLLLDVALLMGRGWCRGESDFVKDGPALCNSDPRFPTVKNWKYTPRIYKWPLFSQ